MRELLRTTDPVRLSWLTALLAEQRIAAVVFDTHMSVLEGSAGAIPRRLMVADDDHAAALQILREAGEVEPDPAAPVSVTADRLLGGRVLLRQPAQGYRAAIDPVLLAAAVPALGRGRVLDLGSGVGAAALCYAARVPGPDVVGLELQPDLAALAQDNAAANGMADRVRILAGDLLRPPPDLAPDSFDQVMANPPFLEASRADPSPLAGKAAADVEGAARLADWIELALALVRPKGGIALIHRADRLDEILARLYGHAGAVTVTPLWPHAGEPAKRVIVRARKGLRTPLRLSAGLTLHEAGGGYTAAARAVLYDGGPLPD